ncbi:MAG: hypothetical protein V6Z89_20795 [Desulfobacter sp.]
MKKNEVKCSIIIILVSFFYFLIPEHVSAQIRSRIVVLPFYVEHGREADTGFSELGFHYRRMSGFIENQLVSHGFEVIDPFAKDAVERELSRVMERVREDSSLVAQNMCQRYAVDAAYIVWLKVKIRRTADGYYKATAMVDGKGYDSAGRSLGANVMKTFKKTKRDKDEAIASVEKEAGDVVGRVLTGWRISRVAASAPSGQGILARNLSNQAQYVSLRLDEANEYELVEAFGKMLHTVRGVNHTRRLSQRIVPDNPQACFTEWEIEINLSETDPFRLQANVMKMANDILDAGGTIRIKGVPFRYSPSEMKMMMGLRPGEATAKLIQFVIDRERARDREFTGHHNPENAGNSTKVKPGYE